jgi:hypothetical protein
VAGSQEIQQQHTGVLHMAQEFTIVYQHWTAVIAMEVMRPKIRHVIMFCIKYPLQVLMDFTTAPGRARTQTVPTNQKS